MGADRRPYSFRYGKHAKRDRTGLPPGEARITIEIPIEPGWTPDELDRALEVVPLTGAEIVRGGFTGSWADQGISDGEGWVRERRHRRREERRGK
jgi:hypothetical protein